MEKETQINWRKILTWILLAACLLTVFLPWIRIEVHVLGGSYTIRDLLELALGASGAETSPDQWLKEMIQDSYRRGGEQPVSEDAILDALMCIINGRMNLLQAARTGRTLSRAMEWNQAAPTGTYPDGAAVAASPFAEREEAEELLSSAQTKLFVGAILAWVLLAALVLGVLFASWGVYRGETRDVRRVLVPVLALLVLNLISVWQCNSGVQELMELRGNNNGAISVLSLTGGNIKFVYNGAGPFLCPLFAALAWLTMSWRRGSLAALLGKERRVPALRWVCPSCGSRHLQSAAFCPKCGTAKPEAPTPAETEACEKNTPEGGEQTQD